MAGPRKRKASSGQGTKAKKTKSHLVANVNNRRGREAMTVQTEFPDQEAQIIVGAEPLATRQGGKRSKRSVPHESY